ncbi:putative transposase, partial [Alteromonadaceae bacterium Bs31]
KYVQYFNFTYERTGTLWEGRYKSSLVSTEDYLLKVYRYIELNPVRAGMVEHASEYPWSSYQGNAVGKTIKMLSPHSVYQQLANTVEQRQSVYRSLFRGRMAEREVKEIRDAANKSWVLGDERFKTEIAQRTGRSPINTGRGGDRRSARYRGANNQ